PLIVDDGPGKTTAGREGKQVRSGVSRRSGSPPIISNRAMFRLVACTLSSGHVILSRGAGANGGSSSPLGQGNTVAKHIFVTGGVVSSLGKGLTCASIGMLLEHRGLRVRLQKFDPYINVDPGTMSPYQHGEVYVLDDGSETDLDLGHYERFTEA